LQFGQFDRDRKRHWDRYWIGHWLDRQWNRHWLDRQWNRHRLDRQRIGYGWHRNGWHGNRHRKRNNDWLGIKFLRQSGKWILRS